MTLSKFNIKKFILIFGISILFVFNILKLNLTLSSKQIVYTFKSKNLQNINNEVSQKLKAKPKNFSLKDNNNFPQNTYAERDEDYNNASSYIVIDEDTGEILADKDSQKSLPVASLTKVMTAVVALDLANKDDVFEVSQNAANKIPTKIGVIPGQKMTLEELLDAMLLTSANDATQVVMEGVNNKYQSDVFIDAMNEKAGFLGLKNTHFENPQGLDSRENYSSSYDLALLSHYALTNYSIITQIVQKDYEFLPENNNHKQFDLYNWNGLIGVYPGVKGLKIGNTEKAGYTTIVSAQRDGKNILTVLLGAPRVIERDLWASMLLDYGFKKADDLVSSNINEIQLEQKYSTWKYWN